MARKLIDLGDTKKKKTNQTLNDRGYGTVYEFEAKKKAEEEKAAKEKKIAEAAQPTTNSQGYQSSRNSVKTNPNVDLAAEAQAARNAAINASGSNAAANPAVTIDPNAVYDAWSARYNAVNNAAASNAAATSTTNDIDELAAAIAQAERNAAINASGSNAAATKPTASDTLAELTGYTPSYGMKDSAVSVASEPKYARTEVDNTAAAAAQAARDAAIAASGNNAAANTQAAADALTDAQIMSMYPYFAYDTPKTNQTTAQLPTLPDTTIKPTGQATGSNTATDALKPATTRYPDLNDRGYGTLADYYANLAAEDQAARQKAIAAAANPVYNTQGFPSSIPSEKSNAIEDRAAADQAARDAAIAAAANPTYNAQGYPSSYKTDLAAEDQAARDAAIAAAAPSNAAAPGNTTTKPDGTKETGNGTGSGTSTGTGNKNGNSGTGTGTGTADQTTQEILPETNVTSQAVVDAQNALANAQNTKPQGYVSKYADQLDAILQQIQNPDQFKWDFNGDELFKMYADEYTQRGKQASMDAMGQAAALTGGYGNSYAQQVGNQAYDQYLTELYNRGFDLRDRAYEMWKDQQDDLYNQYSMLANADATDYSRYADARDFDENVRQFDEALNWDKMSSDQKYAAQYAMQILANGQMPSTDMLKAAGLSEADAQLMIAKISSGGGSGKKKTENVTTYYNDANGNLYELANDGTFKMVDKSKITGDYNVDTQFTNDLTNRLTMIKKTLNDVFSSNGYSYSNPADTQGYPSSYNPGDYGETEAEKKNKKLHGGK